MIQLPQLHESLLIANERLVDRARRRARLFRTGMLSSVAALSIGGVAVAGQALWGPILGHEDGNRPTASQTPVPAEQRALLGVLQREQTAADRGPAARGALAAATRRYRGIRVADVRVLRGDATDVTLVLVPVAGLTAETRYAARPDDALCVASGLDGRPESSTCFSADDVRRGRATGSAGSAGTEAWGIVPDSVAAVAVPTPDGGSRRVAVADNAFRIDAAQADPERLDVTWIGTDGATVRPEGGRPMTLRTLAGLARSPARPGSHDCGPDRGGVVPQDVACGADARRYTPPPAQDGSGADPGARPTP